MKEIEKTFSPKDVEKKWYSHWEENKYFKPLKGDKGGYCIIMPPPNVTGKLHMGHATDIVTQDVPIRFKRMKGYQALWLPGMDHAGIATQSVVEKKLWEDEKKTRYDLGRDEFLKRVWKWKEEYGGKIVEQQKALGSSCDWDYSVFTMDPEPNQAVKKVFVDLFNEGLIYQADYIINWDTQLQSAISDAEVEFKDVQGAFYHIKYQIKDSKDFLVVATTRPETLLGDTGIAVHPEDDRFKHFIGKSAIVPLCGREIPIVGDDYVDREKGTGCLKVTPGHDFNDFEIGKRHNFPIINILNNDGTLNENALQFNGQTVKTARENILAELKVQELFVKEESITHPVGHGDRSKTVIEPRVSKQWFLNVQDMAADAVKAIETGKTEFIPKQWENTYFSWLREPRNWCISRQLWWGHRIPVYTCSACAHAWASIETPQKCSKCEHEKLEQDPDVLDTWFSSGLWPFSTLGWPDEKRMQEKGFDTFFPTSTLVTGFDIIFFWVARMMMMSLKTLKQVPFEKIYIHAIVRDKFGNKMSKSLGNGIDPLEMVEKYGADALRFSLAAGSGYNRNINLDIDRIEGYRNFVNKIWNAFRFISPFLEKADESLSETKLDIQEKWILGELNRVAGEMNHSLEEFRFDDACSSLYAYIYDSFCGFFIELSKPILYGESEQEIAKRATVLKHCFREIVKLLHPISPYITEELWTYLKKENEDLVTVQPYPEKDKKLDFPKERKLMSQLFENIVMIRNLRVSVQLKPKDEIEVIFKVTDPEFEKFLKTQASFLDSMARVTKVNFLNAKGSVPNKALSGANAHTSLYIPFGEAIDIEAQKKRLNSNIQKTEKDFQALDKKLSNKNFIERAKEEAILDVKEKHEKAKKKLISLKESLALFS